jgi:hypothetical protein
LWQGNQNGWGGKSHKIANNQTSQALAKAKIIDSAQGVRTPMAPLRRGCFYSRNEEAGHYTHKPAIL